MRATLLIGLVAWGGCNSILGIGDLTIAGDVPPGDEPGATCLGNSLIHKCPQITGDITLNGAIDTDTFPMCQSFNQAIGPGVCAIAGNNVTIQTVTGTGSKPLVIMATGPIIVMGDLDVSSERGQAPGAGANFLSTCASTGNGLANNVGGGGGGAGGSFGGQGGDGTSGGSGTSGGAGTGTIIPQGVRGGCPGAIGGNSSSGGADSGGAVYLIAMQSITLTTSGHIYANGAGGRGGPNGHDGGFGGGSGGLIGLEAPTITMMNGALVTANGGGGGEGGNSSGTGGMDGEDGHKSAMMAARGGTNSASGGDGGDGSVGGTVTGQAAKAATMQGGGGGGGGGAGIVWVTSAVTGAISPPAQMH